MAISKDGTIRINEWAEGIGISPFLGFEEIRNLNVDDSPGTIYPNAKLTKESSTTVTELITDFVKRADNEFYGFSDGQLLYKGTGSTALTWALISGNTKTAQGAGLALFRDYLFATQATKINTYGDLSGSPGWNNSWQTIDTATTHKMLVGQDDILYGLAGRYIYSVQEVSGQTFDPGNAATYTFTKRALALPEGVIATTMEELGAFLMIGADDGKIYPWDKSSDIFELPIIIGETIAGMTTVSNILYILTQEKANIYASNGTSAVIFKKIPQHLTGTLFTTGSLINLQNRLLFGVSTGNISGVYSVDLETRSLSIENTISAGDPDVDSQRVGALIHTDRNQEEYLAGWENNAGAVTYGIDRLQISATGSRDIVDNFKAFFITNFYRIGTQANPKKFSDIQGFLGSVSGGATSDLKIEYRTDTRSAFTTYATIDMDDKQSFRTDFGVGGVNIQFKISFNFPENTDDPYPELLELIIK